LVIGREMLKVVRINKINTIYVEKYILFIVDIIESSKLIIIIQLNNTVHQHCCIYRSMFQTLTVNTQYFFFV